MSKLVTKTMTICGSTKFKDLIQKAHKHYTLLGYIVLSPCIFEHSGDPMDSDTKEVLKELHREYINKSDIVLIVSDKTWYIGDSTYSEILYSIDAGKEIWLYNDHQAGEDKNTFLSLISYILDDRYNTIEELKSQIKQNEQAKNVEYLN